MTTGTPTADPARTDTCASEHISNMHPHTSTLREQDLPALTGDGDGVAVAGGGEYTAGSSESPTDTWYTRVGRRMIAAEPSK